MRRANGRLRGMDGAKDGLSGNDGCRDLPWRSGS